jgi:hypothetical protein
MASPDRLDPLAFAGSFAELESDLPHGVTLPAWRSERNRPAAAARRSEGRGAGADLAPQRRTPWGVRMWARRPRSGRGPSPRRYK